MVYSESIYGIRNEDNLIFFLSVSWWFHFISVWSAIKTFTFWKNLTKRINLFEKILDSILMVYFWNIYGNKNCGFGLISLLSIFFPFITNIYHHKPINIMVVSIKAFVFGKNSTKEVSFFEKL